MTVNGTSDPLLELFVCKPYDNCKLTKRACLLRQEAAKAQTKDALRYDKCPTCDVGTLHRVEFPTFNATTELEKSRLQSRRRPSRRDAILRNPRLYALAKDIVGEDESDMESSSA